MLGRADGGRSLLALLGELRSDAGRVGSGASAWSRCPDLETVRSGGAAWPTPSKAPRSELAPTTLGRSTSSEADPATIGSGGATWPARLARRWSDIELSSPGVTGDSGPDAAAIGWGGAAWSAFPTTRSAGVEPPMAGVTESLGSDVGTIGSRVAVRTPTATGCSVAWRSAPGRLEARGATVGSGGATWCPA